MIYNKKNPKKKKKGRHCTLKMSAQHQPLTFYPPYAARRCAIVRAAVHCVGVHCASIGPAIRNGVHCAAMPPFVLLSIVPLFAVLLLMLASMVRLFALLFVLGLFVVLPCLLEFKARQCIYTY